jgi:hypothetical protein
VAVAGEIDTTLAGTVTDAVPEIVGLETEVAVMVTATSLGGGAAGAL